MGPSTAPQDPDPIVLNLLITLAYAGTVGHPENNFRDYEYPKLPIDDILNALNEIPRLNTIVDFTSNLQPPTSPPAQLLSAIHTTEGILAPAAGGMVIPGFAPDIQQFIVVNPLVALQNRFDVWMKAVKGRSLPLFYGAVLRNLQPAICALSSSKSCCPRMGSCGLRNARVIHTTMCGRVLR
jgi:hypothetical protein